MSNPMMYVATMAVVTYLIRVLPLTLFNKPITNIYVQSFLYYVPYVTLAVMTFPTILYETNSQLAGLAALIVVLRAKCKNVANKMQKIGFKKDILNGF